MIQRILFCLITLYISVTVSSAETPKEEVAATAVEKTEEQKVSKDEGGQKNVTTVDIINSSNKYQECEQKIVYKNRPFAGVYIGGGIGYDNLSITPAQGSSIENQAVNSMSLGSSASFYYYGKAGFGATFARNTLHIAFELDFARRTSNSGSIVTKQGSYTMSVGYMIGASFKFGVIFFEKNMLYAIGGIQVVMFESNLIKSGSVPLPFAKVGVGYERMLVESKYVDLSLNVEGFYRIFLLQSLLPIQVKSFNISTGLILRF